MQQFFWWLFATAGLMAHPLFAQSDPPPANDILPGYVTTDDPALMLDFDAIVQRAKDLDPTTGEAIEGAAGQGFGFVTLDPDMEGAPGAHDATTIGLNPDFSRDLLAIVLLHEFDHWWTCGQEGAGSNDPDPTTNPGLNDCAYCNHARKMGERIPHLLYLSCREDREVSDGEWCDFYLRSLIGIQQHWQQCLEDTASGKCTGPTSGATPLDLPLGACIQCTPLF